MISAAMLFSLYIAGIALSIVAVRFVAVRQAYASFQGRYPDSNYGRTLIFGEKFFVDKENIEYGYFANYCLAIAACFLWPLAIPMYLAFRLIILIFTAVWRTIEFFLTSVDKIALLSLKVEKVTEDTKL